MTRPDFPTDSADLSGDRPDPRLNAITPPTTSRGWPWMLTFAALLTWGSFLYLKPDGSLFNFSQSSGRVESPPLVMQGGDPYLRALMRTISASEANTPRPYHVIYGGQYVRDLSQHPNRCVPIAVGPNRGNCSTASGRYQFLNTTWAEKAHQYHPHPQRLLLWKNYSFEPQYQDQVLYRWLADSQAWGVNLSQLLRKGAIDDVLKRLSPTWTSLGYGIEDNVMTRHLPKLYQQLLQEELQVVSPAISPLKTAVTNTIYK